MATKQNTPIDLAVELAEIGNALWRIKELSNIAAHCLFDDQLSAPTLAVLAEIVTEMADANHARLSTLEAEISRKEPKQGNEQPDWSSLEDPAPSLFELVESYKENRVEEEVAA